MKLVVSYSIGDECTWSATEVVAFEYRSKELFLYDLEKACLEAVKNRSTFELAGHQWDHHNLGFVEKEKGKEIFTFVISVETLGEWFKRKSQPI